MMMVIVDDDVGVCVGVCVVVAAAAVVRAPRRSCAPAFSGRTHPCRALRALTYFDILNF